MTNSGSNIFGFFGAGLAKSELLIRPLILDGNQVSFTYGDLDFQSARIANVLKNSGCKRGDRVAVVTEKCIEFLALYAACLRIGAIFLPLNPSYTTHEIEYFLVDSKPHTFVVDPIREIELGEIARKVNVAQTWTLATKTGSLLIAAATQSSEFETRSVSGDEIAALLYTSGTTGRSKAAMLSHENLSSNALALISHWNFSASDILIHSLPVFHTHGLFVACHCVLFTGAAMRFNEKFESVDVIKQFSNSTVLMGVPTFYTRLLDQETLSRETTKKMRLFISGSAPLLSETHENFYSRTGFAILERYGMTETSMLTSNPLNGKRKPGTVGLPLPITELRINSIDQGIEVRGPSVFKGYWQMPEKTNESFTQDGFFKTGDAGTIDKEGYVTISGRQKDLIITGGFNVYPKEIESVLDEDERVKESAVVGSPDTDFGETVTAFVVLHPGPSLKAAEASETEASLIARCREKLAGYKVPKRIFLIDELPRNTMGKVQKNELRKSRLTNS